jgi:hypothetical protein
MLGLVRRIGCAIILLVAGAALWHFRDLWWPSVRDRLVDKVPSAVEEVIP